MDIDPKKMDELVISVTDTIVNHEELMRTAAQLAEEQLAKVGIIRDTDDYLEGSIDDYKDRIYYSLVNEFIITVVTRSLGQLNRVGMVEK